MARKPPYNGLQAEESVMHHETTLTDRIIVHLDRGMRAVLGGNPAPSRENPAQAIAEARLDAREQRTSIALMRVNHAGEVAAQALYHGQSLAAHRPAIHRALERASVEENDHLAWCRKRLEQLSGRTSILDPVWYAGCFAIGALAGLAGDRWSLGFLAETERQVVAHLDGHLQRLPAADKRSRAILERMREDESAHATSAVRHGGTALPAPIKVLMRVTSRIMTRTALWL